jgi:hypothetical protein
MRAKTVTHVEYEVLNAIMDDGVIAETIENLKMDLVPDASDEVAERRFNDGVKNVAQLILNMAERRLHRLPPDHPDYQAKPSE